MKKNQLRKGRVPADGSLSRYELKDLIQFLKINRPRGKLLIRNLQKQLRRRIKC